MATRRDSTNIAVAGKWGPRIEDVFSIENGDIPASYVSLPEGSYFFGEIRLDFPMFAKVQ